MKKLWTPNSSRAAPTPGNSPSAWAKEATDYCPRKGIFAGDGAGNYGWQKPITREATAQIIYNLLEAAGMLDKLLDVK